MRDAEHTVVVLAVRSKDRVGAHAPSPAHGWDTNVLASLLHPGGELSTPKSGSEWGVGGGGGLAGLFGDGSCGRGGGFGVEVAEGRHREVVVELVDEGLAGADVHLEDLLGREALEVHLERAQ